MGDTRQDSRLTDSALRAPRLTQSRQAKYAHKMRKHWREQGNCSRCGLPCPINPHTKRPYFACMIHRNQSNAWSRRYRRKSRKLTQMTTIRRLTALVRMLTEENQHFRKLLTKHSSTVKV